MDLKQIRKAINAGVVAGVAAFSTGIKDGNMDNGDWALVVGALLVTGYTTYKIENAPAEPFKPGPRPYGDLKQPPPTE